MKTYVKVLIALLCLVVLVGAGRAIVSANDSGTLESEVVTEAVSEDIPVEYTEALKEVLIILGDSDSKSEAVDRIMEAGIVPNATAGEVSNLVDSFVEMAEWWDCKECFMYDMTEGLQYGLDEEWLEGYWYTYFPGMPESCEEDVADGVMDALEESKNKTEAILAVAQKLGITTDEAEEIVNAVIKYGDEYFGDASWWSVFKTDVRENMTFWVTVIVAIAAILAIVGGVFVLIGKINPTMRRALFGVEDVLKNTTKEAEEISQTLANITNLAHDVAEKDEIYNKLIAEKEEHIEKLCEKIAEIEASAEKERRSMFFAGAYNLQILRIICSRTAMPLADKAAIDLWYTRGINFLKGELSPEDIAKIESMAATLEVSDGDKI